MLDNLGKSKILFCSDSVMSRDEKGKNRQESSFKPWKANSVLAALTDSNVF